MLHYPVQEALHEPFQGVQTRIDAFLFLKNDQNRKSKWIHCCFEPKLLQTAIKTEVKH